MTTRAFDENGDGIMLHWMAELIVFGIAVRIASLTTFPLHPPLQ